jgi:uncharacterized protein
VAAPDPADDAPLPIKLGPCSNGEHLPLPPGPVAREAVRRARLEADLQARRLGWTRRRFLTSICGSAVTLLALNACSKDQARSTDGSDPGGSFAVPPEGAADPEAAGEVLRGEEFIFDVQTHLLDFELDPATAGQPFFGQGFPQSGCGEADARACFSIEHYLEEIFLRSDTSFAVLSAIPVPGDDNPLSIESMEETRAAFERICDEQRLLQHGQAMPNVGTPEAALDAMSAAADAHDLAAWKVYTHAPAAQGFWLDDHETGVPQVGEGFLQRVEDIGIPILCVHKGFGGGSRFADPVDVGPAAAAHPDITFVVYHSGYESAVVEGPYDPAAPGGGIDRLLASLEANGIGVGGNVYCELGSTWRAVMGDPDQAAHVLGKLLKAVGEDNVVWGTDSIWYGTPQDQIQAFRAFQISPALQEQHGYPALTDAVKAKILGLTSASIYGIEPTAVACPFTRDDLEQMRIALPPARTLGPSTLAEHARVVAAHRGF